MPGTFIISLDCEGKWGMADQVADFQRSTLTNKRLTEAYRKIIDILNHHQIKGTFAFVAAFTMSVDEYRVNKDWFANVHVEGKSWLGEFSREIAENRFEGWFNPDCFNIVRKETQHEIASHGFSHLPLAEFLINEEDFIREINLIKTCSNFKERRNMTFVYPRNLVGYTNLLRDAGFIGYRDGVHLTSSSNKGIPKLFLRAKSLFSDLNIKTPAKPHSIGGSIIPIPASVCLNWRHGLRKKIPMAVTIKRWRNIIKDAITNQKVAHLHTHPHNFITGDQMYTLLEEVLKIVSNAQRRSELVNLTQREYVEGILGCLKTKNKENYRT